ncbi:GNAT family N-acetyltransferase, partial [Streptomyces sp. NPDC057067]|uniref:GNAT family N-acetyltransferase n=1 Tax=Streptomyces sp. NPDC057067 TaxID=3346013 RepID=UPI0036445A9E
MNDTAADLRFVPLDAGDPATLDAWLRLTLDSAEDVPLSAAPPCAADLTGSVRFAPPGTALAGEVALLGGQAVGAIRLVLPDGAPVAVVDQLLTAPKERRQGIGTALFRRGPPPAPRARPYPPGLFLAGCHKHPHTRTTRVRVC